MSKLIILRGPSGAGKSTVAKMLQKRMGGKTALVEQDYFRLRMFVDQEAARQATRQVVVVNVRAALGAGCNVVLEGILTVNSYKDHFEQLFKEHPEDNFLFYFDVGFEETVRRHATRKKSKQFGEAEMREWYNLASPYGHPNEHIIPEDCTAQQACDKIAKIVGLGRTTNQPS